MGRRRVVSTSNKDLTYHNFSLFLSLLTGLVCCVCLLFLWVMIYNLPEAFIFANSYDAHCRNGL